MELVIEAMNESGPMGLPPLVYRALGKEDATTHN